MKEFAEQLSEIKSEFEDISYALDERRIRLWCAARARAYNRIHERGGVMLVHKATGVSRRRIYAGIKELEGANQLDREKVRVSGGGRKKNYGNSTGYS